MERIRSYLANVVESHRKLRKDLIHNIIDSERFEDVLVNYWSMSVCRGAVCTLAYLARDFLQFEKAKSYERS